MLGDTIFRALIEALPDAIVITDRHGTILLVNGQTEALFGYERSELIDQPVEVLVPDELRERHVRNRVQYSQRPGTRPMGIGLELEGRRKDGSRFPVEISLAPLVRGQDTYVTSVVRDVTERQSLRREIEVQQERQRIAMDLHDGTIQSIYAVGLGLELALADIASNPAEASQRVDAAIDQLNHVIADVRAYIFDLRPVQSAGDLAQDLIATIDEFRASSTLKVSAEIAPSLRLTREDRATAMLHIAREGLSNARKHARASEVHVSLVEDDGHVDLEIRDNGVGFEPAAPREPVRRGLRNMRLRAQQLGGLFDLESRPGAGTTLRVRMPTGPA